MDPCIRKVHATYRMQNSLLLLLLGLWPLLMLAVPRHGARPPPDSSFSQLIFWTILEHHSIGSRPDELIHQSSTLLGLLRARTPEPKLEGTPKPELGGTPLASQGVGAD